MAKRGLGRGLGALLGDAPVADLQSSAPSEVPLDELAPNQYQPRSDFDTEELAGLAASIRAQGLIQPILVVRRPQGGYMIVAGERRWRAAREAGLDTVPVIIREELSKRDLLEAALVENVQRSDLNPVEEANAFQKLHEEFGLSHSDIGGRVGKSRSAVSNRLRLLGLPDEVKTMLRQGLLSEGQARPLLGLPSAGERVKWARRAVKEGLNARQLEAASSATETRRKKKPRSVDPDTGAAERRLTKHLQTKVEIRRRGQGGALVLNFHSEEELIRLYEMLMEARSRA